MMKFMTLMAASSAEEAESIQKIRQRVPAYPRVGPLDAGSKDAWLKWNADFVTFANINKLTGLITPPHYGEGWTGNGVGGCS